MERDVWRPVSVGISAALVGFSSSFAVVLSGLAAVGATRAEATTGLIALCLLLGAGTIWLSLRHRRPLLFAWSTPGAAVLVSTGAVHGGWPAAVGAFAVTGVLILLTAAVPGVGRLIAAIPAPLAQAMLAGILLSLCLKPVTAFAHSPLLIGAVIVIWVVLARFAPRWAAPVAFAVALLIAGTEVVLGNSAFAVASPLPVFTMPSFTLDAVVGIAVPLYIVTMASQNVPGVAIMAAHGYAVPWRESLLITGAGTVLGAPAGGHAINLAAITAALPASSDAHPDPDRRWIAAHAAGWAYVVLGALAPVLVALAFAAPDGLIEAVAGLALLGTFASALAAAFADPAQYVAVTVTLLIAASPVALLGIGPSFWSLGVGILIWMLFRRRSAVESRAQTPEAETEPPRLEA